MNDEAPPPPNTPDENVLREKASAIVARGERVREDVAALAREATRTAGDFSDGLVTIIRSVIDGASAGLRDATAEDSGKVLREVIDGLGQGMAASAEAARLTIEESKSKGSAFAAEDLDRIGNEFRSLGDLFVETVSSAATKVSDHVSGQANEVAEHARRALDQSRPVFEEAVRAARESPGEVGREAWEAGKESSRQAIGALFREIGSRIEALGDSLTAGKDSGDEGKE